MRTLLLAVLAVAISPLWPVQPAAQQQAPKDSLFSRIVHTDPAAFRQAPAVHGGAGSMGFASLLNRGAVTPEFNFLHRGVIPPGPVSATTSTTSLKRCSSSSTGKPSSPLTGARPRSKGRLALSAARGIPRHL